MLSSGCQDGVEVQRVWGKLVQEERKSADWLGGEMDPVFAVYLEEIGRGSVNGGTQGLIVREKIRALDKALADHRHKKDRPEWAWRQRDKISNSWPLAQPGADSTLSNREFGEAAS